MKHTKSLTSACRYCRYYQPEGRRGGVCQKLGAPVQSNWKACSLASSPFSPSWEELEDAWSLPDATAVVASDLSKPELTPVKEKAPCSLEPVQAKAMMAI